MVFELERTTVRSTRPDCHIAREKVLPLVIWRGGWPFQQTLGRGGAAMRLRRAWEFLLCVTAVMGMIGCSSKTDQPTNMVKLQGAGASFPAPLYNKWFREYSNAHQNVLVDYQSVGSGTGVKSVVDHTVDFGASDAAMKPEDMAKVPGGVQLFPMTAGSIVLAYNLKGVDNLKLSRKAYSGELEI